MSKKVIIAVMAAVLISAGLYLLISQHLNRLSDTEQATLPIPSPTATAPPKKVELIEETPAPKIANETYAPTPSPVPSETPPPLNNSDEHLSSKLSALTNGPELVNLLSKEESIRKIVRAVYGLSEGRIVREYRPITSPKGLFEAYKIGQQTENTEQELFRISRANDARYSPYIALFSSLNTPALITLYGFYLPTFEAAYQELGIGHGDFHSTLLKAVDVLLDAPITQDAILLIQPSVMYKFADKKLEKLPSAHKLMLRMGQENREALKLELREFKARLIEFKS
ncbi:MAG: DUF3014 domain-containing protein [Agarilytica sp.]